METNTILLIGAGFLGALLAVLILIKIIKGILQMGYLLLVLGSSAFLAYYIGTPEGSTLLPATVNMDVRLVQAAIVIIMPLVLSFFVAILMFTVRQIFKSGASNKRMVDTNPTPVMPFHPASQAEQARIQRNQHNPYAQQNPQYPPPQQQYPPQNQYPPAPPTVQNMPPAEPTHRTPPAEPTRPNPIVRDEDR